jgi:hypothetical protein
MRTFITVALSTTLIASTALAADVSPLTTGKPAGVKQAQAMNIGTTDWVLLGVGVVTAIAIGVASSSNGSPVNGPQNIAVTATTI